MTTEARIFLGIGAFLVVASTVYWFGDYEDTGTTLLATTAALGLVIGGYLARAMRPQPRPAPDTASEAEESAEDFLPHASVWPFWVGAGAVVSANGLALGLWAVVPGTVLLLFGILGYARQSRRRD